MATFTVTTRRDGEISFQSDLSDDKVTQLLKILSNGGNSFASDLLCKFDNLSPKQYAWAHKLAIDSLQKVENHKKENNNEPSQFEQLFAAFEAAKNRGAKRMVLRFSGINVKPNRDLSALWVTSQIETEMGQYGQQAQYLGKVTRNQLDSRLPDDVKSVIMDAADDPLNAAIRYGKVSGECSCCGRELTRKDSIERGIGPICAEKFGW
jgi:hypothetical protein